MDVEENKETRDTKQGSKYSVSHSYLIIFLTGL